DRDDLCLDPRRIAQMADAFSRALDVDPRRLLDQAYAYGGQFGYRKLLYVKAVF
ncbi:TPA: aminoglycoside phosphotransferase family protein, partial [Escherichia coli]